MIWKVEYAPRAQEDLDEIFEYYATDQLDDSFAESLIVRLVKAVDSLAEMPLRLYRKNRGKAWACTICSRRSKLTKDKRL